MEKSGYWKDVWLLDKKSVKHFAINLHNPFWKDVLKAWAEFINDISGVDDYMKQLLWNNLNITIDKKITCRFGWINKGVRFVNDLLDESGCLLTPDTIKNKFNLNCSYLEIYNIISAMPESWKTSIRISGRKLEKVSSKKLEEIFTKKKCTKITYSAILQTVGSKPKKTQSRWSMDLSRYLPNIDWKSAYKLPFSCTVQTKLQSFQYRILHRTLVTNTLLVKMGILNVENCTFCLSASESIVHLFWHCNITQSIWQSLAVWITESTGITLSLSCPTVILGLSDNICKNSAINFIILATKYYIYKCKMEGCNINFSCLQNYLKHTYNVEKLALNTQDKSRHEAEWRDFKNLFI